MKRLTVEQLLGLLIAIGFLTVFVLALVNWKVSYQQSKSIVGQARAGCERGKLDRRANAQVARSVLEGFQETDRRLPGPRTPKRAAAEQAIAVSRAGLEARSRIDCERVFPKPSPFSLSAKPAPPPSGAPR